jgi:energy-coupling factor transport system ATP-binding protein
MSINFENVSFVYLEGSPYEKKALNNINLSIKKGEIVGLIGHTGSGKSTLIQHLNGLLLPKNGRVLIDEMDTKLKKGNEIRKKVGLVFQYPEYQLFEETVRKDIAFGPINLGLNDTETNNRVDEAISNMEIDGELLEKSPFELSGGQKRKVAIAGVLAMDPEILVLDEPAAGLDPHSKYHLYELIKRIHKEKGITIILVSHNMADIADMTERTIVLHEGSIVFDSTPRDVFSNKKKLNSIGLDVPDITKLFYELSMKISSINSNIYTISEAKNEILKYYKLKNDIEKGK